MKMLVRYSVERDPTFVSLVYSCDLSAV